MNLQILSCIYTKTLEEFLGESPDTEKIDIDPDMESSFRADIEWFAQMKTKFLGHVGSNKSYALYKAGSEANVIIKQNDSNDVIGGYCDSVLWIEPQHRGKGLAPDLVRAVAILKDGTLNVMNMTDSGRRAIENTYISTVIRAHESGIALPDNIIFQSCIQEALQKRNTLEFER